MFAQRLVESLLNLRKTVLVSLLAMTLGAGYFAAQVPFDNSIEIWFLEDDPSLVTYKEFLERFDGDQRAIVGVFSESNLFTRENIQLIKELTEAAREVPFASDVQSLTTIDIVQSIDDDLEISPLFKKVPTNDQEVEEFKNLVISNPVLYDNLVSADQKATAIFVSLQNDTTDFVSKVAMTDALEALKERTKGTDVSLVLSGAPVTDAWFDRFNKEDAATLLPLSILMIMLATFLVFRRYSAATLPLVVVGVAIIWTFGLMGIMGLKLTVIGATLTAIILAVGVADTIHVLADYYHEKAKGLANRDAIVKAVSSLLVPCLFTSATTIAGLLSLSVSQLKPIQEFGWLAGFGVLSAFVLSVTLCPILLFYIGKKDIMKPEGPSKLTLLLESVLAKTTRHSKPISLVAIVLLVVAGWGFSQMRVGANPIGYFKPDSEVRDAIKKIDEELGGTVEISFYIKTEDDRFKDPDFLERLDKVNSWIEEMPGIRSILSPTDSVREIDRVLNGAKKEGTGQEARPTKGNLPKTKALAAQYYLILEGSDDFEDSIQDDYSIGRMTGRGELNKAHLFSSRLPEIESRFAKEFPEEDVSIQVTGYARLMGDMENYLLDSQIKSFLIAFIVVTFMLGFLLRSVSLGVFSMIPNLVPIFLGLGFMGLVGVPLDPATVMIGAIAMGLVVDDTVHFLVRLRRHSKAGSGLEGALRGATLDAGRPIVVTSFVLICAFSIMVSGSFTPNINFGFISAVIILLALLADLILLPAALRIFRPTI